MNQPLIDPATFGELQAAAGADFVPELIDTFLEEGPRMLAELRAALAAGDAERYRRTAHSLKTNGLTFGATALAAAARDQELGGLGNEAALAALSAEFERAAAALMELRDAS
jgi:histidine phosphotransfer protein HptB